MFALIKNSKLKTEFEVKKREAKAINHLKEDQQTVGLLVAKEMSPEEVYSYPLTILPLALSDPSGNLQRSQKAPFRNYLISEFKSTRKVVLTATDWVYNGMAVVRVMSVKSTWKELSDTFLEVAILQKYLYPASMQTIMDTYDDNQIKEIPQMSRGNLRSENLYIERRTNYASKYK